MSVKKYIKPFAVQVLCMLDL